MNRRGKNRMTNAEPMTLGSLTHVGMKRSNNQDAFCVLAGSNAPVGTQALLAVADGMGGHKGGEVASNMTIKGLVGRLTTDARRDADASDSSQLKPRLISAVTDINAEVYQAAQQPQTQGMGTTLTAAVISSAYMVLGHVGDSRAYVLRKGELVQVTKDHSWVGEEIARGALTPEQAREHPRRNIVTRAIGIEPQVQVDTTELRLMEGDVILLCSDGLHGLVEDSEIAELLKRNEPQRACQKLVDRANELGGNDNCTVVVARINSLDKSDQDAGHIQSMTTLRLSTSRNGRNKFALVLKIVFAPVWAPFWAISKLVRLLIRPRPTK